MNRPTGIGVWLLVLMDTPGTSHVGEEATALPPDSLILWEPDRPHRFGCVDAPWSHSWMLVGGTFVTEQVEALEIPCGTPLQTPVAAEFERMLQAVLREVSTHLQPNADYVRNHLHNFLIELGRSCHAGTDELRVPAEYLAVRRHIEHHYTRSLTLRELAAQVGRSVPRFSACYRGLFGISPIEHVLQLRMEEAQYLLRDHNLTVSQIADRLGYCNVQHFSQQFRNRFGVSPSRFRHGSGTW